MDPPMYNRVKRGLDCVGAAVLLVGLAPLMAAITVLILLDTGPPAFFTQTRVGRGGGLFRIFKFRTLVVGSEAPEAPARHTTAVGAPLRRWALDELPQLWNVLRGDMSLVGPRPVPPHHLDAYGSHERVRLRVRPGLTGWAQIHGRNALCWSDRFDLDAWYVRHRCLTLDLRILLRTPGLLVRGTGTYGRDGANPPPASS